jgi:hypothetical protein
MMMMMSEGTQQDLWDQTQTQNLANTKPEYW